MKWAAIWLTGALLAGLGEALELPPHPRLLLNREGVEQLKERIKRYEWARERWRSIEKRAERWLKEEIKLPPRGGNWWHWYACPVHGARLRTGRRIGEWRWEHICTVGGEVLLGDPSRPERDYDGCVISGIHHRLAGAVRDLGLAYQVTGDRRYAEKAEEILIAYAKRYLSYPLHDVRGRARIGGGRVGPQTLDESTWLIPICQGADLIWETLSEEERRLIADKLLLPAAKEVILPHKMGVHNIQCWKNSAVGLVGFLLGDEELIREAIDNPERGYWRQMRDGVRPDGVWWEGAWGYHFYTLSALWSLTEAARNCGIDLYCEELKKMFDAPLNFAMPNLHLPPFNDSDEVDLRGRAPLYELAYARYGDPRYVPLIREGGRRSDFALWFGVGELPEGKPIEWRSANYPDSGYAILARGEGKDATWLCLKYGPHGGGHGHPDKLNFVLYARGKVVALDPGTARYGLPIQREWYRTTLAHNTLTVDETSQKPSEGKSIAFGAEGDVEYAMADAGPIYEGVKFKRTVILIDEDHILLVDQVRCDRERLLDLAYHNRGRWAELPEGEGWRPPDKPGYKHIRDATIRTVVDGAELGVSLGEGMEVKITLAGGEETEVITGTGVGDHIEDRVPMVIFRRRAKETAFIWGISLDGRDMEIKPRLVRDAEGNPIRPSAAVAVECEANGKRYLFVVNPEGIDLRVELPSGEGRRASSPFASIPLPD
ncbi:heparinase [Candidatus Poribacteria bacterium]|nr:MAG: heparinase [Candidatus Poribacteria bacterium]